MTRWKQANGAATTSSEVGEPDDAEGQQLRGLGAPPAKGVHAAAADVPGLCDDQPSLHYVMILVQYNLLTVYLGNYCLTILL